MVVDRRIAQGLERGRPIEIELDGEKVGCFEGETIAAALIASGRRTLRHSQKHDAPRGIFCGMGICFECLMTVDGVPNVRSCVTYVKPGMKVETQHEAAWKEGR